MEMIENISGYVFTYLKMFSTQISQNLQMSYFSPLCQQLSVSQNRLVRHVTCSVGVQNLKRFFFFQSGVSFEILNTMWKSFGKA